MQMSHRPVIAVVTAVCLSVTLGACGGDKGKSSASSSSSSSSTSSTSSTSAKAAASPKLQPRKFTDSAAAAANPTIADYIQSQHINETPVHRADPGAPKVEIQFPDGWQNAGDDTPDYAYGAIVYGGPQAASGYQANIIALVSKLDGPADPDKLMQLAGGEMKNLPGFVSAGEENGTSSGFPAYRIAGTYDLNGVKAASGQETVVFKGADGGLYVLQMNATSDESQSQALFDALGSIDKTINITG